MKCKGKSEPFNIGGAAHASSLRPCSSIDLTVVNAHCSVDAAVLIEGTVDPLLYSLLEQLLVVGNRVLCEPREMRRCSVLASSGLGLSWTH